MKSKGKAAIDLTVGNPLKVIILFTIPLILGNLFHYVLSNAFKDDFNFDECFNDYIKDKVFTNKEKFFTNKLKEDLLFTINVIKKQDEYSLLSNALYEQKRTIPSKYFCRNFWLWKL